MLDTIKEMFDYVWIEAPPVYSLEECIAATKKQHPNVDDENDEDYIESAEDLIEHFRTSLYLSNEKELAFLQTAAELTESRLPWKDNVRHYPFRVFGFNHLVFLFLHEDELHLVLPTELIAEYHKIIAEENFAEINARNNELFTYATALVNLYGTYEIEQFVAVWNRHRKDKITAKEAEIFLINRAYFNSDYYLEDGFVVHDCLSSDDFDELFEATLGMDYYMPTKSVIGAYASQGYDEPNFKEINELCEFLSEFINDEKTMENLPYDLFRSCERLKSPDRVIDALKNARAPLKDQSFCERFERLYNNLRSNIHVWELRGFLPHQFQAQTGESVPRFSLSLK